MIKEANPLQFGVRAAKAVSAAPAAQAAKPAIGFLEGISAANKVMSAAVGVGLSLAFVKSLINKVNNDAYRKHIIEDLALTDPIIRNIDKRTLLEWYAAIYHYAPNLSKDKQTVGEVLRNFARFNKVDLNTLKMLADTEKSISDANKSNNVSLTSLVGAFR